MTARNSGERAQAERGHRVFWSLVAIIALSTFVKGVLAWHVNEMECLADECDYLALAKHIRDGDGLRTTKGYLFPPGYPYVVAGSWALFGQHRLGPALIQILASAVTIVAVFRIGELLYDRRAALASAALLGFYPNSVAFTHLLWAETLYAFWLTLAILWLVREPRVGLRSAALCGLCLGAAALTKGVALHLTWIAAAWIVLHRIAERDPGSGLGSNAEAAPGSMTRRIVVAAVLVSALLVAILPWTVRNWLTYDRFLLLAATTGRNLYHGTNVPEPPSWDLGAGPRRRGVQHRGGRPLCTDANIVDRDRCEVSNAVAFALSHPGLMIARVPTKLADLLNPTSFVIRHIREGYYPRRFSERETQVVTLLIGVSWMLLAALALAGLVLVRPSRGLGLLVGVLMYHMAVHAVTFGTSRYRIALIPLLALAAGPMLTRSWKVILRAQPRWRPALVLSGVCLLIWLWSTRWNALFDVFGA